MSAGNGVDAVNLNKANAADKVGQSLPGGRAGGLFGQSTAM